MRPDPNLPMEEDTNQIRFEPNRLTGYSQTDILQEIRRVIQHECKGVVPSRTEFARLARLHPITITQKFGSYGDAVRQAGFVYLEKYNPDQVRANLLEVLKCAGGYRFSQDFFQHNGGTYSVKTVKAILGLDWDGILNAIGAKEKPQTIQRSALGLRREQLARLTKDDFFRELERIWKLRGQRPTNTEFRRESALGTAIYERLFVSWTKAVEAYCMAKGVQVQGQGGTRATKSILLNELKTVSAKSPGRSLTYDLYKSNGGTYSRKPFETMFGSWTKAVNAAGCVSGRQAKYSNDQLFDEIQRLWERLERQPTSAEMREQGRMTDVCFHGRFGSWTNAIYAFCKDRAAVRSDEAPPSQTDSIPPLVEPSEERSTIAEPTAEETTPCVVTRRTGRSVPKRLRFLVLQRDSFTCRYCGRSPKQHGVTVEADHIIAWTKGGETIMDNLQTLCMDCNRGKSNL